MRTEMPKSEMNPMMEGMLTTSEVIQMLTTPPTSAKGRFTIIMVESGTLLNSWNRSMKTTRMASSDAKTSVREADCWLSNCPPYST